MVEIRKLIPVSSIYKNNLCTVLKQTYFLNQNKFYKYAYFKFSYCIQLKL